MATLKRYPTYKDSGIEWLGMIPSHWGFHNLKYLCKVNLSNVDKKSYEDEMPVRLCNYTDVYYNQFITSKLPFMEATASQDQVTRFSLQYGDVLITKDSEEWNDIAVPAYVSETINNVVCGYHLAHIRPVQIRGNYLFRSFQAKTINEQFQVAANGITRYGISKYDIENALFLLPPPDEQQAIADYLDKKTARIDNLIAKKQRQIELLKEQRQAVINQAVTKGLNPDAKMKDSGIDWLGKIPDHWEVKKLKYLASLKSGDNITSLQIGSEGKIPVYGGNGIRGFTSVFTHDGDYVIFGRQGALCGNVHIASGKFWASEHAVVAHPRSQYNIVWFSNLLQTMNLNQYSISAAQPGLSVERVENLGVPTPSVKEQHSLATYINLHTEKIDTALEKDEKQIHLLQEYRTALISESVTGKIDVRNG